LGIGDNMCLLLVVWDRKINNGQHTLSKCNHQQSSDGNNTVNNRGYYRLDSCEVLQSKKMVRALI